MIRLYFLPNPHPCMSTAGTININLFMSLFSIKSFKGLYLILG